MRHNGAGAKAPIAIAIGLLVALLLVLAAPAQAKEVRPAPVAFGTAAQPSFTEVSGLAVDQSSGELYVLDGSGANEVQTVTVSATAGQFKLRFKGKSSANIAFNATAKEVKEALLNLSTIGKPPEVQGPIGPENIDVSGGPGDAGGTHPYEITFVEELGKTDVEQLTCPSGSTPLSGGVGCSVTTTVTGSSDDRLKRYHADGSPDEFSALGSNEIDGKGTGDATPQNGLLFPILRPSNPSLAQVAIDESGGPTDGDVYVSQNFGHLIDIFAPSGAYLGQLTQYTESTPEGPKVKSFGEICAVAVDPAGTLYVGEALAGVAEKGAIHKYAQPAVPHSPLANADSSANFDGLACQLALGAGPAAGALFKTGRFANTFKIDATTGAFGYVVESEGTRAVAVNRVNGRLFTAPVAFKGNEVREFDVSDPLKATPRNTAISLPAKAQALAVYDTGSGDEVYVAREGNPEIEVFGPLITIPSPVATSGEASEVERTTATLNGSVNPKTATVEECRFEYGPTSAYGQTAPCETADGNPISSPTEIPHDSNPHALSAKLSGLEAGATYHFRLFVANSDEASKGADKTFATHGGPTIEAAPASQITTTTAQLNGLLNPHGEATEYAFEYVAEAAFEESGYNTATTVPLPAADAGAGTDTLEVSEQLSGLQPDTAYHFRLTASNASDPPVIGPDGAFATFAVPAGLPDGRAYEQVSPAAKIDEVFPPEPFLTGLSGSCASCVPGSARVQMVRQSAPDGSAFAYEGGPFAPGLASDADEYIGRRQAGGWSTIPLSFPLYNPGFEGFSSDLTRGVLRQVAPALSPQAPEGFANLYLWEEGAALTPLITRAPPHREPGKFVLSSGSNTFNVVFGGGNAGSATVPAFSHLILQANDSLTLKDPGIAPEAPAVGRDETDVYEYSGGQLRLVSVLPGNAAAAADAAIGAGTGSLSITAENLIAEHAISADGRRIFWSALPSGQVYVREDGTKTTQVPDSGRFLQAAPDGSKVLLNDGAIYDLEAEAVEDLTAGKGGFQGMLGAAEDLSRVYFVDTKALTPPSQQNANGEHAEEGKFNLYLGEGEDATTFIGQLLGSDNTELGRVGAWHAAPDNRLAQVSADGRFLAFMSKARLTGYDNTIKGGGGCLFAEGVGSSQCSEVFEYDAATGTLACPSCNPSGERPLGHGNLLVIYSSETTFQPPDDLPPQGEGRLFFESQDTLTPADENGHIQDVYEWEPDGVGGCESARGCVSLISSGRAPNDSHFIGASASGDDVFFATRERLVPQDTDEYMDLYDARVGGGFAPTFEEPCEGEACRGPATSAPELPGPASSTFSTEEPPPRTSPHCRKGKVRRHGRCVPVRKHHRRARHRRQGGAR
jgi:hypothetical protein